MAFKSRSYRILHSPNRNTLLGIVMSLALYAGVAHSYVPLSDEQLFEYTPLMTAVAEGDLNTVKKLLASGHDPDSLSNSGGTALMVAARKRKLEIAKFLLQAGADPGNCGSENYCPLWYAVDADSLPFVKLLVESGADPKWAPENNGTEYPPLQMAVHNRNLAMVKYLVDAGADMEFTNYWSNYAAPTPLAVAIAEGYFEIVKFLLNEGAEIHEATEVAYTRNASALEYARKNGHPNVTRYVEKVLADGTFRPKFTVEMFVEKLYSKPKYHLGEESAYALEFLERISMEDLRLLRNTIFARKNYRFNDESLIKYFGDNFSGYKPETRDVTISDIDEKNVGFIKLLEQRAYNRSIAS